MLGNLPRVGLAAVDPTFEVWYLRGYLVFALCAYMRWAFLVINKICDFLDINCLTIKNRRKEDGVSELRDLGRAVKHGNGRHA